MAAGSSEVLREYLIRLGFQIDQRGQRNFDTATVNIQKRVMGIAQAVTAVTGAATAMVVSYTRDMEKMYYASRKAEAPVAALNNLAYGYRQIGLDGKQAIATVEGIARSMRSNPGLTALLKDLGVPVQGRTKDQVLLDLVGALRKMPEHIAIQYGNLFGIDPDQLKLLTEGYDKLLAAEKQRQMMTQGLNIETEAAAKAAVEYANALDKVTERAKILFSVISVGMLPYFKQMTSNLDEMLKSMTRVAAFAQKATPAEFWAETKNQAKLLWETLSGSRGSVTLSPRAQAQKDTAGLSGLPALPPGPPAPAGNLPLGLRNNNPGNLRAGLGQTGTNKGFATFDTPEQGLAAMARQLLLYQNRDGLKNISQIIKKYAPASENNTQAYIDAVTKATGFNSQEYIDLNKSGNLAAIMEAMVKHENGRNPFSSAQFETAARQGAAFQQQTNITVYGATDPTATANAVGGQQRSVNSDLMRQMGTRKVE